MGLSYPLRHLYSLSNPGPFHWAEKVIPTIALLTVCTWSSLLNGSLHYKYWQENIYAPDHDLGRHGLHLLKKNKQDVFFKDET